MSTLVPKATASDTHLRVLSCEAQFSGPDTKKVAHPGDFSMRATTVFLRSDDFAEPTDITVNRMLSELGQNR